MLQWPFDHWLYRAATLANLFSFPFCRFFPLSVIFWGMYTMGNRVPNIYYAILCFSMFIMSGINTVLFWRLFKNDVLRGCFGYGCAATKSSSSSSKSVTSSRSNVTSSKSSSKMSNGVASLSSNGSCVNNNESVTLLSRAGGDCHVAARVNGHLHHQHHE